MVFVPRSIIFEAKASVLTSGSYFHPELMIEMQFYNVGIYFRNICLDELRGNILEPPFTIYGDFTRSHAHQKMRLAMLYRRVLVSARDLNP